MATYGIDYYGTTFYGSSAITQFSAGNFLATPIDYGVIQLTWGAPTGAWDYIRLLRSPYGFAVNADDGDLLLEVSNPGPTLYFDRGQTPNSVGLSGGKCYYYTLLVHGTALNKWQVAGTAVGISVKNYLTNDLMYQYLPEVLRANIPADDALDSTNDFLYRFLKLFAFSLDLYKTQADNVMSRYDVTNLDGRLIPTFMQNFNIPYEPSIGVKQSRIFLKNVSLLLQDKGTKKGLNEFIKAYGGYDSVITMGKNLMLDQNDCSFEQTIGNWASVSNATLVRYLSTAVPSIPPYSEIAAQANFPNLQGASLKVTSVATANTVIALTGVSPVQYGIPVQGATAYTLTAYARAAATVRAVSAQIFWYDSFGKFISSSTGSTTNDAVGSWTRITNAVAAASVPSNAVFAVPQLTIASTVAGEIHYFDAIQFEQATSATFYQDARQIQAVLVANRINSLINPNCEGSASIGWSATNGTLALNAAHISSTTTAPSVPLSTGSIKLTATAVGTVTLASSSMPIFSGNTYTFSIYSETTDAGAAYPLTPYVSWYNGSSALIATTTGTPVSSNSAWHQVSVSSTAPSTAVTAVAGFTWNVSAMPSTAGWQDVAYGGGNFVALIYGSSNAAISSNGSTWTTVTMPANANWQAVDYGNGKFVAIAQGPSNIAATSPDGITWTARTLPASDNWASIVYGGGKFVAISQNSIRTAVSTDGITWTSGTLPSSVYWVDVTYGNSTYVAIAADTTSAATSPDGITWTARTLPTGSSGGWSGVCFGNSTFVAVDYSSSIAATSPDGITWTARTLPSTSNWSDVAYGGGNFVATSQSSTAAATSPDGITWTARTLPSASNWYPLAYGGGVFVVVAYSSNIAATSPDGITWTALGTGNSVLIDAGLFEKSAFVGSYFDGNNGLAELADLFWEGSTANQGRSHYYKNRFAVQSRLVSKIPSWIVYGSTFELFLAQAGT